MPKLRSSSGKSLNSIGLVLVSLLLTACGGGSDSGVAAGAPAANAPAQATSLVVAPKDVGEVSAYIDPAGQSSELAFTDSSSNSIFLAGGRRVGGNTEWSTVTAVVGNTTSQIALGAGNLPLASLSSRDDARWLLDMASPDDLIVWRYQGETLTGGARIKMVGDSLVFYEAPSPASGTAPVATLNLEAAQMRRLRALADWPWMRPSVVVVALTRLAQQQASAAGQTRASPEALTTKLVTSLPAYTSSRGALEQEVANPLRVAGVAQEVNNRGDAGLQGAYRDAEDAQIVTDPEIQAWMNQLVDDAHNQFRYTHSGPEYLLTMSELALGIKLPSMSARSAAVPSSLDYQWLPRRLYGQRLLNILVTGSVQGVSAASALLTAPLKQLMQSMAASAGTYGLYAGAPVNLAPAGGGNTLMFCSHPGEAYPDAPFTERLVVVGAAGRARLDGLDGSSSSDGKQLNFAETTGKLPVLLTATTPPVQYFSERKFSLRLSWDPAIAGYRGTAVTSITTSWDVDATQVECATRQDVSFNGLIKPID